MLNRVFVALTIVVSFATAGVLFKNSEIAKGLEHKLSTINNLKYSKLYCFGIVSTTCLALDMNLSDDRFSIFSKRFTIENIEKVNGISGDENGTFPFAISFEEVQVSESEYDKRLLEISDKLKDDDLIFDIEIVGKITRLGFQEDIKIDHLLISNNLFDFNLSLDMRIQNKKSFLLKMVSIKLKNRELLERFYTIESQYRKYLIFEDFRKELVSKIESFKKSGVEKDILDSLKTLIQDNGKDIFEFSISTKSKEHLDVYQLFITYNMLYMFQGLDAIEKELQKTFNIKIEAK